MHSGHRGVVLAGFIAVATAFHATPALAHKLSVFAVAEGNTIRGRAFLHGGGGLDRATVRVLDPQGEELGRATTDAEGKFQWEARRRCDHRLVVDAGDGHRAEYTIRAAVLPASLAPRGDTPQAASHASPGEHGAAPLAHEPADESRLAAQVQILTQQIEQLQMQLAESAQKSRLQDVLGGIGYILGLMGLTFYFLGVRRRDSHAR